MKILSSLICAVLIAPAAYGAVECVKIDTTTMGRADGKYMWKAGNGIQGVAFCSGSWAVTSAKTGFSVNGEFLAQVEPDSHNSGWFCFCKLIKPMISISFYAAPVYMRNCNASTTAFSSYSLCLSNCALDCAYSWKHPQPGQCTDINKNFQEWLTK